MATRDPNRFRCPPHWTAAQRLDHYTFVDPLTGCHIFTGTIGGHGYGVLSFNGITHLVHRLTWHLAKGPIPKEKEVLHNCPHGDNRACRKLDHLWLGTKIENVADMVAKGRQSKGPARSALMRRGSAHQNAKLTEEQARSIYVDPDTHRKIAARFGISKSLVTMIKNRQFWRHIHGTPPRSVLYP